MSAAMSESENFKAHILVVDDEPEIRKVLSEFLGESYQCVVVASAEEALALLAQRTFDLIISDISMELMSGLEMVTHVLRLAPQTVIIMISGQQTIQYPIEAMRAGAFDYIPKPFDLHHVEKAVRRALGHHNLLESKRLHEDHLKELVQQHTAQIERLANYDKVTGLPNRVLFEDRLARALAVARNKGQMLGMLFFAFDRFKEINDTLGHAVGDLLLKEIAARLQSCVRETDIVARFDGDEFALLLTQVMRTEDLIQISRAIDGALKPAFVLEGHEVYVHASIGISVFPHDGEDLRTLLMNAGTALNRNPVRAGTNYRFYTSGMNSRAATRLDLESSFRRAIENEEFLVHYQPQVDIQSKRIVGAEALVRWQHPKLGLLPPDVFISLAEESGSILPLGAWTLRQACAQTRRWQKSGFAGLRVAVNVSAQQIEETSLFETVVQTLAETGLEAECLELELTETSFMQNTDDAAETFTRLREMGVKIAIDDFGTGYSSLGYLKHLPVDSVKLDQSFVSGATTDPDAAALIMAIVTLAHNLRLKVIAEGIETEEQLAFLKLLRCDQGQGYLFGKPVSATLIESLMTRPSDSETGPVRTVVSGERVVRMQI